MTTTLAHLVTGFFHTHLAAGLGYSPNTIASYSTTLRLLLEFAHQRLRVPIEQIALESINQDLVTEFLEHLATHRHNGAATCRLRLAAIKAFLHFAAGREPCLLEESQRIQAIRSRPSAPPPRTVLSSHQAAAILQAPVADTALGRRDRAILLLLYNTGMRVQELCDLSLGHVRFLAPAHVDLTGKGNKRRQVPLWKETVQAICAYLDSGPRDRAPDAPLFVGRTDRALTRFGVRKLVRRHTAVAAPAAAGLAALRVSPHTFRHTTATRLLHSSGNIVLVRDWLGHSDVRTTMLYTHITAEAKRQALERFPAPSVCAPGQVPQWTHPDTISFLAGLSRKSGVMLPPGRPPPLRPSPSHRPGHITPAVT